MRRNAKKCSAGVRLQAAGMGPLEGGFPVCVTSSHARRLLGRPSPPLLPALGAPPSPVAVSLPACLPRAPPRWKCVCIRDAAFIHTCANQQMLRQSKTASISGPSRICTSRTSLCEEKRCVASVKTPHHQSNRSAVC